MAGIEKVRVADPPVSAEPLGVYGQATGCFVFMLDVAGEPDYADALVARQYEIIDSLDGAWSIARGWTNVTVSFHAPWIEADPYKGLLAAEASGSNFAVGGVRRGVIMARLFRGMNLWLLGDYERAIEVLSDRQMADEEQGQATAIRPFCLVQALADVGRLSSARAEAEQMLASMRERGNVPDEGRAHWALAEVLRREGDLERAETAACLALEYLEPYALDHAPAHATLAAIRLAQGRPHEALELAELAASRCARIRGWGLKGGFVGLTLARVLTELGETERAEDVLAQARARLLANAEKIADDGLRKGYLEAIPEHASILSLTGG
jgi:tetratricopeptide (TPR) repeat protein